MVTENSSLKERTLELQIQLTRLLEKLKNEKEKVRFLFSGFCFFGLFLVWCVFTNDIPSNGKTVMLLILTWYWRDEKKNLVIKKTKNAINSLNMFHLKGQAKGLQARLIPPYIHINQFTLA